MKLELYVTGSSGSCGEIRAALEKLKAELRFELREVNIDQDPVLSERYRGRAPALVVDGSPLPDRDVIPDRLLEALRRRAPGAAPSESGRAAARGVSRRTKVVFTLAAGAVLVAVVASKAYQIAVEPQQQVQMYLGIEPQSGAAPDFAFKTRSGASVRLADYRGKTVFLNFWATWCDTCRVEMPSMQQLALALRGDDFAMLAASVDDSWEPIDKFFAGVEPAFELLHDPGAQGAGTYGTVKFPETYVIGPDGRLIAKFTGPREWDDPAFEVYFKRLLGRRAGAPAAAANPLFPTANRGGKKPE